MTSRAFLLAAILAAHGPVALAQDPSDGVLLKVNSGPGQQDVTLTWTGGQAPYWIYRSSSAQGVVDPANLIAQTMNNEWTDLSPVGSILYYLVTPACVNVVGDGSFEAGPFGGIWSESSTNFGTPICSIASCGSVGTGPRTGTYWAWFGGIDAVEIAVVSQSIVIPPGTATLTFWLENPICRSSGTDTFDVAMDGTIIYATNNHSPYCNIYGYRQATVDVSAWATGTAHTLRFRGTLAGLTSFMLDDVRLESCP